jgi:hypothetical protein
MDCTACKSQIASLFYHDADQVAKDDIMKHIQKCSDCRTTYRQTQEVLMMMKPRFNPNTPSALKQNIIQQLKTEDEKMKTNLSKTLSISARAKKLLSIAAIIAVIMMAIPIIDKNDRLTNNTAKAAGVFIESSIKATQHLKSMVLKLKIRTIATDNFSLVGTEYSMVDHTIWKQFTKPEKWKVDKGERVLMFDGNKQYLWMPQREEAYEAERSVNITEWLTILLEPEKLLMKEKESSTEKDSKITMDEKNGELLMTITSSAQGNFINDYCKNKSIDESDNRREYIFDLKSKLLKSLRIYIIEGQRETLILETTQIDYNTPIAPDVFAIKLPTNVEWRDINCSNPNKAFQNITSKRAAELFLQGMANNDWSLVEDVCDFFANPSSKVKEIKAEFSGLTIVEIGEPFKSGLYPGEFVPCEIILKSGQTEQLKLALRNDNDNKAWIVDGGF